jgi:hypothetical protein
MDNTGLLHRVYYSYLLYAHALLGYHALAAVRRRGGSRSTPAITVL